MRNNLYTVQRLGEHEGPLKMPILADFIHEIIYK